MKNKGKLSILEKYNIYILQKCLKICKTPDVGVINKAVKLS